MANIYVHSFTYSRNLVFLVDRFVRKSNVDASSHRYRTFEHNLFHNTPLYC